MNNKGAFLNLLIIFSIITLFILIFEIKYLYLVWNLALAIIPFVCAMGISYKNTNSLLKFILAILWLFFYPNAIYIFTDFIHLTNLNFYSFSDNIVKYNMDFHIWLILVITCLSFVLGSAYSYLSFDIIFKNFKTKNKQYIRYLSLILLSILTGIAIFIGRFMRFNTWDIIKNPIKLYNLSIANINTNNIRLILLFSCFHLITMMIFETIRLRRDR
ncbi:MAG: DUF1361 domain-containing protein [Tissierellia bacterium]|nr:DUF1361 domain-containing protein [Tissierellia bacterium]